VVLVERFETPAPVGSGLMLQPTGMAVLQAMGLADAMSAHGRRIVSMRGRTAAGRLVLEVGYNPLGPGASALAVHRSALFGVLFDAALAEGVELETGFEVIGAEAGRLSARNGASLGPFDLAVDATGARSCLAGACGTVRRRELAFGALWATLPWPGAPFAADRLEQRYRSASVMAGVLPIGRRPAEEAQLATFFWSLKPKAYEAWRVRGLEAWKQDVIALWPEVEGLLAHIAAPEELTLARYGHHTLRRPVAERLAVIGDAAHSTSPQLGQGANMGLLDAWALARGLEAAPDLGLGLAAYAAARRGHVRLYQALSSVFTPFYQSDSRILPAMRDLLLAPAVSLPFAPRLLALMVAGLLEDPRPRLGLM
jgi:2-polyprenyl-6-methoxyphenol hydroxylase-like FAD-dependent oxidoreductase